ncbi:hypothetical protein OG909_11935 [Streptomyces sp. NBC_01754]|uniref:hypothetical protein n=1 Tax=Streptomyces sp. NBC_01754 TaxID=2975930 RepID=UPI002DDA83FC|nr:hypothetical protein [Streptomyces sp. NBC_01754]WSC92945.1 hypothetical protein OG909_11935 [Streptomyces sp. NBC_01754]
MNDETQLRIRQTFARLSAESEGLSAVDRTLRKAFERLMYGLPWITDGKVTIVNLCAEAGVSRASYYRSPVSRAVKEILDAPLTRRPEPEELRAEVARLKRTERELRRALAAEVRELRDTTATYASQIQVLALRNTELAEENSLLIERLRRAGGNIALLPARRPSPHVAAPTSERST